MDQTDCGIKVSEWSDRQDVLKFFFGHWGYEEFNPSSSRQYKNTDLPVLLVSISDCAQKE